MNLKVLRDLKMLRDRPFRLRVLHFNDLHGRLSEDVSRSEGALQPVFSRMAAYIRRVRAECAGQFDAGVLVFSGGDDLVGSAFSELIWSAPRSRGGFRCHPAFRLYSAAGVDAGVVGNHDVDWGLALLSRAARQDAAFPLLSANLKVLRDPSPFKRATGAPRLAGAASRGAIRPAARFVVHGLRVGVIGVTTPAEIKHVTPGEFAVLDPVAAVSDLLPAMRPLCDVLIVLSHLGYSLDDPSAVVVGAGDVELARALPYGAVHLIIGGHTHSVLNEHGLDPVNCINGIPIVQAGAHGRYLGEVTIDVTLTGAAVTAACLHRVDALAEDSCVKHLQTRFEAKHVRPLAVRVQRMLRKPIGVLADASPLAHSLQAEGAARTEGLARFVADALVARCRVAGFPVDFALVDASSVCADLPQKRVVTFGDVFRMAPYADSIVLCRLTAAQLQALLDDNARRSDPEGAARSEDGSREERGFLHFSREVSYRLVFGGPLRSQAHAADVTIDGVPLAQLAAARSEPFLIACSSFVRQLASRWERKAAAAGAALFDLRALPVEQTGLALRAELVAALRRAGSSVTAARTAMCRQHEFQGYYPFCKPELP